MVNSSSGIRIIEINDKKEPMFRKVVIDDSTWTIVDMFGNIVTPFFKEEGKIVQYQSSKCLVLAKEEKGKKRLYDVSCSKNNPDGSKCKKVSFPFEVKSIALLGEKTLVFTTTQGLCLVDTDTLKQKSDFYEAIYRFGDSKTETYVYEKEVSNDELSTIITGPISLDGKVGTKAYDTYFNKEREIESSQVSEFHYDVIDTTEIIRDLNDKTNDNSKKKISGVKKILKNCNK